MSRISTTGYALLSLIAARATSTYELAQWMRWSNLRAFWPRAESQVYKEPKNLAAEGLADAHVEYVGERKRTVYSVTERGREALADWLEEPSDRFQYRYEAAVKVAFANHGSIEALRTTLRAAVIEAEDEARQMLEVARNQPTTTSPAPEREHLNAMADGLILEVIEARLRWARAAEEIAATWTETTAETTRAADAARLWRDFERRLVAMLADSTSEDH